MSESKGFYEIGNTGNGYLVTYHTCERGGFIHRQGDQGTVVASVKTLEEAEKIFDAVNTKATVGHPASTVQTWYPPTTRVVSVALLQKVHDLIARQEYYDDEVDAALFEIDAIIKLPPL